MNTFIVAGVLFYLVIFGLTLTSPDKKNAAIGICVITLVSALLFAADGLLEPAVRDFLGSSVIAAVIIAIYYIGKILSNLKS